VEAESGGVLHLQPFFGCEVTKKTRKHSLAGLFCVRGCLTLSSSASSPCSRERLHGDRLGEFSEKIGKAAKTVFGQVYDGTEPADLFENAAMPYYRAGKKGESFESAKPVNNGVELLDKAKEMLYDAGKSDALALNNRAGYTVSKNINTEVTADGEGQRSSETPGMGRAGSESSERIPGRSGANDAGRAKSGRAEEEKTDAVAFPSGENRGQRVAAVFEQHSVTPSQESAAGEIAAQAKAIAQERGLEPIFFGGGDMTVKGDAIRGYLDGNRVYVRVDDAEFTAEQIIENVIRKNGIDATTHRTNDALLKQEEVMRKYGISDSEADAINNYKSSDSYKINAVLRSNAKLSDAQEKMVHLIDSAIKKLPKVKEKTLYRTLSFDDAFNAQAEYETFIRTHEPGTPVVYRAYTSASTQKDGYPHANGVKYGITLEIANINARNLDGFGDNSESEVIYPRNTVFIVTKSTIDENGYPYIYIQEVDINAAQGYSAERSETMRNVQKPYSVHTDMQSISGRDSDGNPAGGLGSQGNVSGGQRSIIHSEGSPISNHSAASAKQNKIDLENSYSAETQNSASVSEWTTQRVCEAKAKTMRWAYSANIKPGDQKLSTYEGKWYVIEADTSADLGYRIVGEVPQNAYATYAERIKKDGSYSDGQHYATEIDSGVELYRNRSKVRDARQGADSLQTGQQRKDIPFFSVAQSQNDRRSSENDRNRNNKGRSTNKQDGKASRAVKTLGELQQENTELKKQFSELRTARLRNLHRASQAPRCTQTKKTSERMSFLLVIALQNRSAALPRHILFHAHQKEFFSYRFSKENLPLITLEVQIEWLLQISRQI